MGPQHWFASGGLPSYIGLEEGRVLRHWCSVEKGLLTVAFIGGFLDTGGQWGKKGLHTWMFIKWSLNIGACLHIAPLQLTLEVRCKNVQGSAKPRHHEMGGRSAAV